MNIENISQSIIDELNAEGKSGATIVQFQQVINELIKFFGSSYEVSMLTQKDVDNFRQSDFMLKTRGEKLRSDADKSRLKSITNSIFSIMNKLGMLEFEWNSVRSPRGRKPKIFISETKTKTEQPKTETPVINSQEPSEAKEIDNNLVKDGWQSRTATYVKDEEPDERGEVVHVFHFNTIKNLNNGGKNV